MTFRKLSHLLSKHRPASFMLALALTSGPALSTPLLSGPALTPPSTPQGRDMGNDDHAVRDLVDDALATAVASQSGNWSDPATWIGGALPGIDERVHIPEGLILVYDLDDALTALKWIRVDGELNFATQIDTTLVVETLVVTDLGNMTIGELSDPVAANVEAKIFFTNNGAIDRVYDPGEFSKGLISQGPFRIHGAEKTAWTTVDVYPQAGDAILAVKSPPIGWQIGDTLVLAGTYTTDANDGQDPDNTKFHNEILEITSINGNIIEFDNKTNLSATGMNSLLWDHIPPAGHNLDVHVGNYSRNVSLETQDWAGLPTKQRAHFMMMHHSDVDVRFTEFVGMGRVDKSILLNDSELDENGVLVPGTGTNQRGRYSCHIHMAGTDDPLVQPAMLIGNVVWDNPGWGYVHHNSYAILEDNLAFQVRGSAFNTEDGTERGAWRRNMAIKVLHGHGRTQTLNDVIMDMGTNGHGFWLQGYGGLEFEDNVAISIQGQAMFAFGGAPKFPKYFNVPAHILVDQSYAGDADYVPTENVTMGSNKRFTVYNSKQMIGTWHHMHMGGGGAPGVGVMSPGSGFPSVEHDTNTIMEDFVVWGNYSNAPEIGMDYSSRMTFKNGLMLSGHSKKRLHHANHGTRDIHFVDLIADGYKTGITTTNTHQMNDKTDDLAYCTSTVNGGVFTDMGTFFGPPKDRSEYGKYFDIISMPTVTLRGTDNIAPIARFMNLPIGGLSYYFGAAASSDSDSNATYGNGIVVYKWDLGDGNEAFGEELAHAYSAPGLYTVTLTVFDDSMATDVRVRNINVQDRPQINTITDPNFSAGSFEHEGGLPWVDWAGRGWLTELSDAWITVNGVATFNTTRANHRDLAQVLRYGHALRGQKTFSFYAENSGPGAAGNTIEVNIWAIKGHQFRVDAKNNVVFNGSNTEPLDVLTVLDASVSETNGPEAFSFPIDFADYESDYVVILFRSVGAKIDDGDVQRIDNVALLD